MLTVSSWGPNSNLPAHPNPQAKRDRCVLVYPIISSMTVGNTPPPPQNADKTWLKNPGTSHDGYPLYTSATYSTESRRRSDPTAVPDHQARCNGCILPASTAPLDNVMCQYKAFKLHQQVASAMVTGDRAEVRNAQCGKRVRTLHH